MRIGIDARIYKTGIGRYTRNLLEELAKLATPDDEFVIFLRKDGFDEYMPPDKRFRKVLADYQPYTFAEQLLFLKLLWQERLDLVHFTNFNVPVLWPKRYVVTIHDLIHQSHSTFGSSTRNYAYYLIKRFVYRFAISWVGFRAARVLVPSEATKSDIVTYLGVKPNKVSVTYEGMDTRLYELGQTHSEQGDNTLLAKYGVTAPYLLYVATMYPHKNHQHLIEAFRLLQATRPDLQLVLIGKVDYFSTRLKESLRNDPLKDKIIFPNFTVENGYLSDQDLQVFYRNATAYVFPSLKEGFGIPILEAQAYGLPVLASNTSCLPEIGGDSVLYFDPERSEDIRDKIELVLRSPELVTELVAKGRQNITRFSWHKMAEQTLAAYHSTLR